jgi:glyceraldehyde-3-phosphate dehydrogenase (NADP+)
MKRHYPLLIGGEEVESGQRLPVLNPWDGSLLTEVCLAGEGEMKRAVQSALDAFHSWGTAPTHLRAACLEGMADGIRRRRDELAEIITAEAGKPLTLARGEVDRAANTFRLAVEEARRVGGEVIPLDLQPEGEGRTGITSRFPLGPVAAVSPFNFPLNLVAHKVAPAVAAGNTVVLKPSSRTPVTAHILGEIAGEAGLPGGVLNVVPAAVETAELLVTAPGIRMVTFTGSAEVGWRLRARAERKKVLLELGGNASAVVEPDADLAFAARRIALGSFAYGGQICISVQHVLVHRSVYDAFRQLFLDEVGKLGVGDPSREDTVVGPMITEEEAVRVMEWVGEATASGARLLAGGARKGSLVEPIVLEGTDAAMKIGCREVFGPVVTLDVYDDFGEAVSRVNASCYGLQAGIFTGSLARAFEAFRELEVGGVIVNDYPTFRVDHMPYGGVKESGLGREGVRYAIEEMTESRLMVINLPDGERPR